MTGQWQLAKRVFQQAIELPLDQQQEFVRSHCNDEATCEQVLQMLHAHGSDPGFLSSPVATDTDDELSRDPLLGHQFGTFQIIQRIGKGGMGAVYEASQSEPNRQVAIKVLRYDSAVDNSSLKRFQNESEVLAKLQHPNIAHVYASGSFKDSEGTQPWFAMELVNGFTLSQFLRQRQPNEKEKLDLFLRICDGVSHAHSRDVIHRDIKPANVLIDESGNMPQPKIVDFGIARITAGEIPGATVTKTQAVLGSIDYLSPEQVDLVGSQLDHRCDIYSLGVVAFEMLTGKLPHDRRSSSLTKVLTNIQYDPGIRLRQVDHKFSKDLEVILAKAIEPDPDRRYQSVEQLSEDIRRYLNREPILARPPSVAYRLRKYISRNKVLVGGALTTILALAAGLATYVVIADRANKAAAEAKYEARKAVAVNSFVTNDFLTRLLHGIGSKKQDEPVDVARLIKSSSERIDTMFADDPLLEAAIRNEVGTVYYMVGSFDDACDEYSQSLELWETGLGKEHPDTLKAVNNLTQSLMGAARGSEPETLALAQRAFEGRTKVLGMENPATINSLNNLAQLYMSRKLPKKAEQLFLQGLNELKGSKAETFKTRLTLAANLGTIYVQQRDLDKALNLHRESFTSAKQFFGIDHPMSLKSGTRYVQTLDRAKRHEEALEELRPIMIEFEKIANNDPAALFIPLRLKARILRHLDKDALAKEQLQRALDIASKSPEKFRRQLTKIRQDMKRLER